MKNMVNSAVQYRRVLRKKLRCRNSVKERLLEGFDQTLATYLEEHSNPTIDDLTVAFGPPEELAKCLMLYISPQEQERYNKMRLFTGILSCVLLAVLVFFTIYIWLYKEVGVTSIDIAGINAEPTESTTYSEIGDEIP